MVEQQHQLLFRQICICLSGNLLHGLAPTCPTNAETAPSSLPASRSTSRSRSDVPLPDVRYRRVPRPVDPTRRPKASRLTARPRHPVPVAEPLVPSPEGRASEVAVLPEHASGALPGSRSSVRHMSLSSCAFWWIGAIRLRIPSPCSAWSHHGPRRTSGQPELGFSTIVPMISPDRSGDIHNFIHRTAVEPADSRFR